MSKKRTIAVIFAILAVALIAAATTITGLTEGTNVASDDWFVFVDDSDTAQSPSGSTKKLSGTNLTNWVQTDMSDEAVQFTGVGIGEAGVAAQINSNAALTIDLDDADLTVDCGTAKTLVLATHVYKDLFIPLAGAKVPVSNAPTWSTYTTNLNSYTFALNDYADLATVELQPDYAEGEDFEIHIHIITNGTDGTDRKVKYTAYYAVGDMEEAMAAEANGSAELTITAATSDKTHRYLDIVTITGTGYKIGAAIKIRLKRIASTGTEPSSDPFVEMVGIHYPVNTMGSRTEGAK